MSEAFGIMDPAYFVNKNEILKWINNLLKLNIEKIDLLGSGAAYCQVLDIMYPGSISMGKVNWKAKQEYEFLSNFKIVTSCLEKNDVKKHVDVGRLTKCKYQDNLEFAQWFKRFYDMKCGGEAKSDYDPEARRNVKLSTNVEIPKVARKEQQIAAKQAIVNQPDKHIEKPATTTTTTSTHPPVKKQTTPVKPPATLNGKRPLSQVYATNPSKVAPTSKNIPSATTKPPSTPKVASKLNAPTESKDFTLLVNSIKDILHSQQSETEIVSKIRLLVKDTEKPQETTNSNIPAPVSEGKENINSELVQDASANGSAIEQETH